VKIAGLDQATVSGLAILDGDKLLHAEAFKAKGNGDAEIFTAFRRWLRAMLIAHEVEYLALEEPLPTNLERTEIVFSDNDAFGKSTRKIKRPMSSMVTYLRLYGLRGHAIQVCDELGIPWLEVNNRDWRAVIHDRRSAPKGTKDSTQWWKNAALERCRLMGWDIKSKDAAESALIAEWLRIKLNPRLSPAEGLFAGARG